MKIDQLTKNIGSRVRLSPPATVVGVDGATVQRDDDWIFRRVDDSNNIELENIAYGYGVVLSPTHIYCSDPDTSNRAPDNLDHIILTLTVRVKVVHTPYCTNTEICTIPPWERSPQSSR